MAILEVLTTALGVPIEKFLLKKYLGEPAEEVGGGLLEIAKSKVKDFDKQRDAQRLFEGIGDRVVKRLEPLFEQAVRSGRVNAEGVGLELGRALEGRVSADFFLSKDLDPALLTRAFHDARPLPEGQFSEDERALYDRALNESVRYLVEISAHLPKFEPTLAAESLQRLTHIGKDVDQILEMVQRIEREVSRRGGDTKALRYEADYRQAMIRNLDYVELFGADIAQESHRHSLSIAYVSLSLQSQPERAGSQSESLPAETLFDSLRLSSGRVLIRGEAGSGKSTLFRWAVLQAAGATSEPERGSYRAEYQRVFERFSRYLSSLPQATDVVSELLSKGLDPPWGGHWKLTAPAALMPKSPAVGSTITNAEAVARGSLMAPVSWRNRIPFLIRLRDCSGGRLPVPECVKGNETPAGRI